MRIYRTAVKPLQPLVRVCVLRFECKGAGRDPRCFTRWTEPIRAALICKFSKIDRQSPFPSAALLEPRR